MRNGCILECCSPLSKSTPHAECEGSGLFTPVNTASRKRTRPCVSPSGVSPCLDLLSDRVAVELVGCGHIMHQDYRQDLMNNSVKTCPYGCKKSRISSVCTWAAPTEFPPNKET